MSKLLKGSTAVLMGGAFILGCLPVSADQVTMKTTTTTTTSPTVIETTPEVVTTDVILIKPVLSDLVNRRNDLLARIMFEKSKDLLSSDQADNFMARVNAIDTKRAALIDDGSSGYYQEVKRLYKKYDHLANDMRSTSGMDDRQLADRYGYVAF